MSSASQTSINPCLSYAICLCHLLIIIREQSVDGLYLPIYVNFTILRPHYLPHHRAKDHDDATEILIRNMHSSVSDTQTN